MLISFLGGPDESSLSEGVGRKRNSGLLPRNSLITVLCKGPAASGKGKGTQSVANPSQPSPARFKKRVWKIYRVSSNFRPTASEIIRKVESCMSVSPFSRRATYSLFLPILSASCC